MFDKPNVYLLILGCLGFFVYSSPNNTYSARSTLPSDSLLILADTYNERYQSSSDCMDLANAEALRAYVAVRQGESFDFTTDCGNAWTFFVRGIEAFNQGETSKAETLFTQSREDLRTVSDQPLLASIFQNLGACRQVKGDFSNAVLYYDSAYVLLPEKQSWLLRNNIASLHNEMGNYEDAIFHAEAIIDAEISDEYILTLALLNALSAHTALYQLDKAQSRFLKLVKRELIYGLEVKSLNILLKYTMVAEEDEWFLVVAEKFRDVILNVKDFENTMEPFVYIAYLHLAKRTHEKDFLSAFLIAEHKSQFELINRSALDENLRLKYDKLQEEQANMRKVLVVFIALILLIIIAVIGRTVFHIIAKNRRLRKLNQTLSKSQDVQLIKSSLVKGPKGLNALEALQRMDAQLIKHQNRKLAQIPMNKLSEREKEVLQLIVAGKSVADIALSLGVSTKYVYNIRSSIKRNLKVSSEVSLDVWLGQNDDFLSSGE